jgi:hypothetical protein
MSPGLSRQIEYGVERSSARMAAMRGVAGKKPSAGVAGADEGKTEDLGSVDMTRTPPLMVKLYHEVCVISRASVSGYLLI